MAVTYTAIGIAAALSGNLVFEFAAKRLGARRLRHLLAAVSLSMFGLYELRLPGFMLSPLNSAQSGLRGGKVASVALMGIAFRRHRQPLRRGAARGALLYIGQTGDTLLGGAALFSMAAGMGVPLLLSASRARRSFQKPGGG